MKSRAGDAICHMEVGQPGTPAPLKVREAAHCALDEELIGYTEALGLPLLRERIAQHYLDCYQLEIEPDQVVISTGSSAGFVLVFLATLDVGDRVAIAQPGYPCYREILKALDLEPCFLSLGFENDWSPRLNDIALMIEKQNIKAILLASPSNPTGVVLDDQLVREIAALAAAKGVWFFVDEIYHGLVYDKKAGSAAGLNDGTIVLNSFSKFYSMTGWRIGWMVVPKKMVRRLEKLNQHFYISAPALSQIGAVAAFDATEELEEIKATYRRNRDVLMNGLSDAGFVRFAPPDGAFYIYVDVSDFTDDSLAFSKHLLERHGIAACPGGDFDEALGHTMMRFSYAGAEAEIIEAVRRLSMGGFGR